jgi:hypothetical protein
LQNIVCVPSGELVKILTQEQINIDYDTNGRKLNHQLVTGEWNNEILANLMIAYCAIFKYKSNRINAGSNAR